MGPIALFESKIPWLVGLFILVFATTLYIQKTNSLYQATADSSVAVHSNGSTITNTASATFTSEGSSTQETVISNTTSATPSRKIAATKTTVDASKSHIRLDGEHIIANGSSTYRIVIQLATADGTIVSSPQPQIVITGGEATVSDAILVGGEWFITISSTQPGERTAVITAGGQEIGKIPMTFISSQGAKLPSIPKPSPPPPAAAAPQSFLPRIWASISDFFINAKDGFLYVWHSLLGQTNN